ncbi:extracellular solute-binding protein [Nocardioides caeni]|uniref:Extracellular solute-binding protein n=1 Tax=Nocardioides caeni TaxID=574700 RepID=A0A4S8N8R6_9ACTN|nr:extracellular solute-binding protein [Nocardioides caeni]THV12132.1 extracellular solute-binding protein [Nocardioides caeni]
MSGEARLTWRTGAVVASVAIVVLVAMLIVAGNTEEQKPIGNNGGEPAMLTLDFAVWGSDEEIAAYQAMVDDYNASTKNTTVVVHDWPSAPAMVADLGEAKSVPDLYMLPRTLLADVIAEKRNLPLGDLITAREIPVGDDFSRDAVTAFSVADDLQCMPYSSSAMVIYYNAKLVDFERMAALGRPTPPREHTGWNLSEFRAAAEFASRPRARTKGVYIEPTLRGLAPFIYSGGGQVFDSDTEPTSLALGEDDSIGALRNALELLRDPRVTLSSTQLEQRSALDWFKRGRLGMIAGFRNLTPELRATEGLEFDVMPMPSLGAPKTIGDLTGVCLSPGPGPRVGAAADFLKYLVSDEAMARIAATGYLQPSTRSVALSEAFLQPAQQPAHAAVFNDVLRSMIVPPLLEDGSELQELVGPDIEALLTTPDLGDLQELLRAIDEESRSLLDPDYEPSDDVSDSGDLDDDES